MEFRQLSKNFFLAGRPFRIIRPKVLAMTYRYVPNLIKNDGYIINDNLIGGKVTSVDDFAFYFTIIVMGKSFSGSINYTDCEIL